MNAVELSYLAGAIDSDGTIGILKTVHPSTNGRCVSYTEAIAFAQVDPLIPELLKRVFGGHIQFRARRGTQAKNWRPMYYWTARAKIAAGAVSKLLPYLRIKKAQAEVLLKLRESKNLPYTERRTTLVAVGVRARRTNANVVAHREALFLTAQSLNRPGISGVAHKSHSQYKLTG